MNSVDAFNVTETLKVGNQTVKFPIDEEGGDDSVRFIFVPLAVLIGIMALSALVYLMARNRRKLVKIYKQVQTPNKSPYNTCDFEDNDDPTECLLSGKLQIDNRYDKYQGGRGTRGELYT